MRANYLHIEALARAVLSRRVIGDWAEFGVWRATTFMPLAELARRNGRRIHAVDSFRGLGPTTERDGGEYQAGCLDVGGSAVFRDLAAPFGATILIHEGWVPDVLGELAEVRFGFVHLDLDQYAPTLASLKFLWPRLAPGGCVVCHDWEPEGRTLAAGAIADWAAGAGVPYTGTAPDSGHCWFEKG